MSGTPEWEEYIKTTKVKSKKSTKKDKPKEEKSKLDYTGKTKAELKEILKKRGVKTLYHDTLDILIEKCKESE